MPTTRRARRGDARRARTKIAAWNLPRRSRRRSCAPPPSGPTEVAYRTRNDEISITWGEARERVADLAGRLAQLGLGRGDTVALMLANRPEFHVCDLAVLMTGATPFSVYQTSPPEADPLHRRRRGRARDDHGAGVPAPDPRGARRSCPTLETVIVIDGDAPDGVLTLDDLPATRPRLRPRRRRGRRRARGPADADLHVRHDRAAEGRRDHATAPSSPTRRAARQRADLRAGVARDLVAARRRTSPSATRTTTCRSCAGMTVTCCADGRARSWTTSPRSGRRGSSRCRGSGRSCRRAPRRCSAEAPMYAPASLARRDREGAPRAAR